MRARRKSRPRAIIILVAATLVLGACRKYEPIDVWNPDRPAASSSQPAGRRAAPAPTPTPAPTSTAVERVPLADPIRPPGLPPRRGDAPAPKPPAPEPARAAPPAAPPPSPAPASSPPAAAKTSIAVRSVLVERGETLFAISRRTGVPVRALIEANDLKPPYGLQAGQRIQVPAAKYHEVQPGETLYSVSRRYGVAMSSLVRDNKLEAPYGLRAGERLKIPSSTTPLTETQVASAPPPASPPPASSTPAPGHVLVPPPGATPAQPSAPRTGFLTLPPGYSPDPVMPPARPSRGPAAGGEAPAPPPPAHTLQPPPGPEPVVPPPPPSAPPPPAVASIPPAPAVPPPAAAPPPRDGRGFIWPVRGQVLTRFGPTGRGLHNDGINIAATRGTTVVAADSGVVAYAGNELRGFGNLLLLKHADGWITAYAHNERLLVKRGDRIRRGQPIARVGQTGNVREPQLHFELRRGTRAVDPMDYLGTQQTRQEVETPPDLPKARAAVAYPAVAYPVVAYSVTGRPAALLAALPGPG